MLDLAGGTTVYLACGVTDLRKSYNGLAAIIKLKFHLDRNAFQWPDTPDELRQVTLKEIHWLCDGLSLNPRGAFEEHHPKIIL